MSGLKLARFSTIGAWFGLFILTLLWSTVYTPSPRIPVSLMLVVFVGPLLIPLRGLLHGRTKAHVWTSLLVLLYFVHGIVEAWASPSERWLACLEIVFSIILFASCFFYVQLSKKQSETS